MKKINLLGCILPSILLVACGGSNSSTPVAPVTSPPSSEQPQETNENTNPPSILVERDFQVTKNGTLTITAQVTDNGDIADVLWEQVTGSAFEIISANPSANPNTYTIELKAPNIDSAENATWHITAVDSEGNATTEAFDVHVTPSVFAYAASAAYLTQLPYSTYPGTMRLANLDSTPEHEIILEQTDADQPNTINVFSYNGEELQLAISRATANLNLMDVGYLLPNDRAQIIMAGTSTNPNQAANVPVITGFYDNFTDDVEFFDIQNAPTGNAVATNATHRGVDDMVISDHFDDNQNICVLTKANEDDHYQCVGHLSTDGQDPNFPNTNDLVEIDVGYSQLIDFNNDNKLDAIERRRETFNNSSPTYIRVSAQTDDLTFEETARVYESGNDFTDRELHSVLDFNGDNYPDLVFQQINENGGTDFFVHENSATTDTHFTNVKPLSTFGQYCPSELIDVNGDGSKDMLCDNGTWLEIDNQEAAYQLNAHQLASLQLPNALIETRTDFDGDGDIDLLIRSDNNETDMENTYVLFNDNGFENSTPELLFQDITEEFRTEQINRTLHDIDQDGDLDLITIEPVADTIAEIDTYHLLVRENLLVND